MVASGRVGRVVDSSDSRLPMLSSSSSVGVWLAVGWTSASTPVLSSSSSAEVWLAVAGKSMVMSWMCCAVSWV